MSTIKSDNSDLTINASGTSKDIKFQADGTERMVLKSDGKLGVGTVAPATALEVAGDITLKTGSSGNVQIIQPNNNDLRFHTNNAETLRLEGGGNSEFLRGNVKVNTGNLIIGTAGKGIDFSANSNYSGMSSELLDDYEEGTCSNISLNGSVSGNLSLTGKYIKIGNMVKVTVKGGPFSSSSFGGYAILSNLPFTIGASELSTYQAAFLYSLNTAYTHNTYWYATAGATSCNLYETRDGADSVNVTNTQFGTTYIRSTITYRTN